MSGSSRPAAPSVGLDIGGTALKAVCLLPDGNVSGQTSLPYAKMPASEALDRASLLALAKEAVASVSGGRPLVRVGCAIGGLVRADGSMPADATNVPALAEVALAPLLAETLGAPCHVLNDARAAMHGEAWLGAARGVSHALVLTLGTGFGAGLLIGGRVIDGAHGGAGEIGAWPLTGSDTFEALASPASVERRTGRRLGDLIADGETGGTAGVALDAIGRSLASAHLLLDLELIVLGGSIAAIGEPLRAAVEAAFLRHCPPAHRHGVRFSISSLGAYAGAIGALAPSAREASP